MRTTWIFACILLGSALTPAGASEDDQDYVPPQRTARSEPARAPRIAERPEETETFPEESEFFFRRFGVKLEADLWAATDYKGEVEHDLDGFGNHFHPGEQHDLGLDPHGPGFDVRLGVRVAEDWVLEAEYVHVQYGGIGTLARDVLVEGDRTFAGDPVRTSAEVQMFDLEARFEFLVRPHVRLGLPFGVAWESQWVSVRDLAQNRLASTRADAWTPFVGFSADVPFAYGLGADARVRLFGYVWNESGTFTAFGLFDFEARVYATVADHVRVWLGFRYFGVEHDGHAHNDIDSDFGIAAFVVGTGVAF